MLKLHIVGGIRRGIIRLNPLIDVTPQDLGVKIHQGKRVLKDGELRVLFELIDAPGYNLRNALIIKLALLFGCRVGELLKAKVTDFDFSKGLWIVPQENHKTGRKSKAAEKLIKTAKKLSHGSDYLFVVSGGKALCVGGHIVFIVDLNKKMELGFESYTN